MKCTGVVEVTLTRYTPDIKLVQVELSATEVPKFFEISPTIQSSENKAIRLEAPISYNETLPLANYEVNNVADTPITVKIRVKVWKKDKLAELTVELRTHFDKPHRATEVAMKGKDAYF